MYVALNKLTCMTEIIMTTVYCFLIIQKYWGTSSKHQKYVALNKLTYMTEIIMTTVCCFNHTKITRHVPYIYTQPRALIESSKE